MKAQFTFKRCFLGFCLYNLVFVIWQLAYGLLHNSSFTGAIPLPLSAYLVIVATVGIQIILYLLLSLFQTMIVWETSRQKSKKKLEMRQLQLFLLTLIALLSINCYFFPLSQFSHFFLPETPHMVIKTIAMLSTGIIALLFVIAGVMLMGRKPWLIFIIVPMLIISLFYQYPLNVPFFKNQYDSPNIIIIGVDSLSPEQINEQLTPNLNLFLKQSVHFTETISPLARTYPAWTSILTGLYPLHSNARENLINPAQMHSDTSIAWSLKKIGYKTIYATDDRRFNNLGEEFGFQEIVGPKIGINEILLGSFYDFPLSNLLVNLPVSQWLFPYNYSNRAGHFSYYPATFDHLLQRRLNQQSPNTPLLLAVHFTLPHWPYAWAATQPEEMGNEFDVKNKELLYKKAVFEADRQVGKLLQYLQTRGALRNSMLIILSDHGEVMYKSGSRKIDPELYQDSFPSTLLLYFNNRTSTKANMSAGHGSDLLSPAQFQSVLGFKIYQRGRRITPAKIINTRVSLIDIAPTILSFLRQPLPKMDGVSLLKTLLTATKPPANRAFMLESGMLPNQILTREKALHYGKLFFKINPENNLLQINPKALQIINDDKLLGIIQGNWLLVLYPNEPKYIPVILRLSDDKWTDRLDSPFAESSPVNQMLTKLRQFYKKDLSAYPYSKLKPLADQTSVQ